MIAEGSTTNHAIDPADNFVLAHAGNMRIISASPGETNCYVSNADPFTTVAGVGICVGQHLQIPSVQELEVDTEALEYHISWHCVVASDEAFALPVAGMLTSTPTTSGGLVSMRQPQILEHDQVKNGANLFGVARGVLTGGFPFVGADRVPAVGLYSGSTNAEAYTQRLTIALRRPNFTADYPKFRDNRR